MTTEENMNEEQRAHSPGELLKLLAAGDWGRSGCLEALKNGRYAEEDYCRKMIEDLQGRLRPGEKSREANREYFDKALERLAEILEFLNGETLSPELDAAQRLASAFVLYLTTARHLLDVLDVFPEEAVAGELPEPRVEEVIRKVQEDTAKAPLDERFKEPPFGPPFLRALIRDLQGIDAPKKVASATFPVILPSGNGDGGFLVRFLAGPTDNGTGRPFLAPRQAHLRFDEDFQRVFEHAPLAVARADKRYRPEEQPDVMITLEPAFSQSRGGFISSPGYRGTSAGGALAAALYGAWLGTPLLPDYILSVALTSSENPEPDGKCYPVGDIEDKVNVIAGTALPNSGITFVVAPGEDNAVVTNSKVTLDTRFEYLRSLLYELAGIPRGLKQYLNALERKYEKTPWEDKRVEDIDVPVRIIKKVYRPVRRPGEEDEATGDGGEQVKRSEHDRIRERTYLEGFIETVPWKQEYQRMQAGALKRVVIIGAPGGGKSFLTQLLTLQLVKEAREKIRQSDLFADVDLPVRLTFRDLMRRLDTPDDLEQALSKAVLESLRGGDEIPEQKDPFWRWLIRHLQSSRGWLIIDALDEVELDDKYKRLMDALKGTEWKDTRVVFTSRPYRWAEKLTDGAKVETFELAPFRPTDIRHFFRKWFGDEEAVRGVMEVVEKSLMEACETPLLATLVAIVHEGNPGGLRAVYNLSGLYELLFGEFLKPRGKLQSASRLSALPDAYEWKRFFEVLQGVAWKIFVEAPEANEFDRSRFREAVTALSKEEGNALGSLVYAEALKKEIKNKKPDDEGVRRDELLLAFLLKLRILVRASHDERASYSFQHRTFLEYLAGSWLARQANERGGVEKSPVPWENGPVSPLALVDAKMWLPAWKETLRFFAGSLDDDPEKEREKVRVIQALYDPKDNDYFWFRRAMAMYLFQEMIPPTTLQEMDWPDPPETS